MSRHALPIADSRPPQKGESHHLTKGLLRLTMACNERCPFCNVPVEDYQPAVVPESVTREQLEALAESGQRTLTISGGEPTLLRKRLVALVAQARLRGVPFVELQTNAVLIDDDYASELASAGLSSAFVSLLACDASTHDELVGLDGAFERCLRGIDALLDAEVSVTLNPVFVAATQDTVAAYLELVAERLDRVRAVSLSVVQPHGRAATELDMLPDYARLGPEVRRAQQVAERRGIRLLNPYCGLPLCVGWQDDDDRSVEAAEAQVAWQGAAPASAIGIDNRNNKHHGEPCRGCALRTRCGGAWHAYWTHRGGSGLLPPQRRLEPWTTAAWEAPGQCIVEAIGGIDASTLAALQRAEAPTVWLLTDRLRAGDLATVRQRGATDIALASDAPSLLSCPALAQELSWLRADNIARPPQTRLRAAIGLTALGSFEQAHRALRLAADHSVEAVRLLMAGDSRHRRFVAAMSQAFDLDVALLAQTT